MAHNIERVGFRRTNGAELPTTGAPLLSSFYFQYVNDDHDYPLVSTLMSFRNGKCLGSLRSARSSLVVAIGGVW